ncbi:hypothetical protein T484DRAFT_1835231 [Baffinella frigidus]|nr:hypothetical protein T484DRAFT_1835231 [Cryptophyta sp. CCMP2293]
MLAGLLYGDSMNISEAETLYVKALRMDPDHEGALMGYADLLIAEQRFDRAHTC